MLQNSGGTMYHYVIVFKLSVAVTMNDASFDVRLSCQ